MSHTHTLKTRFSPIHTKKRSTIGTSLFCLLRKFRLRTYEVSSAVNDGLILTDKGQPGCPYNVGCGCILHVEGSIPRSIPLSKIWTCSALASTERSPFTEFRLYLTSRNTKFNLNVFTKMLISCIIKMQIKITF